MDNSVSMNELFRPERRRRITLRGWLDISGEPETFEGLLRDSNLFFVEIESQQG